MEENKDNVKAPDTVIDKSGKEFKAVNPSEKKQKEKKSKAGFGKTVAVPFLSGVLGAGLVLGTCFGVPSIRNNLLNVDTNKSTISTSASSGQINTTQISLEEYSSTGIAVAQKVQPSIVGIKVEYTVNSIFMMQQGTASAEGSGIIISEDGYILTCNHVISGAENIQVRLQNRKNADVSTTWENADVVWENTELDAAILKIRDGKYNALPLRTLETGTFTGEAIYLWGYPFGDSLSDDLDELQASLFQGYISSIQTKNGIERINTNMEAKRGCSGGPVFSKKDGCIIGILCGSQTVGDEGLIEEINYVLPVKYLFEKVFK